MQAVPRMTNLWKVFLLKIMSSQFKRLDDAGVQLTGGQGGHDPPLFRLGGHNMKCPPPHL